MDNKIMLPNWGNVLDASFPYTAPANGFFWCLSTSWPRDGAFAYRVNGKQLWAVYTPNRSNVQMSACVIPLKKGDILTQDDTLGYRTTIFIPVN